MLKPSKILAAICGVLLFLPISGVAALDLTQYDDLLHKQSDQQRISMDFKNASLNEVLKLFSQQSGLNFIASSDIEQIKINLYLDNVPVEVALERILGANNLSYEIDEESRIFVVKELPQAEVALDTRVYFLKHASLGVSKLNRTLSGFDTTEDSSSNSEDTGSGLTEAVKAVLSSQGSVIEDGRTNSLAITDIATQFPIIERTIKQLDIRTPQILIETEILDISKNTADLLGAKFGDTPVTFNGASRQGVWPFDLQNVARDNIPPSQRTAGATDSLFEDPRYETSKISFTGLQFTINFLKTQNDTKNLARPRILTLNNETAEIRVVRDEAIGETATQTSTEGIGESSVEAERTDTGVILTVTPQANINTGEITMAIQPKVINAFPSAGFDGSEKYKDPEERVTKSILRVQDGDTIMLGGLLRTEMDDTRTKVPFIGELPIVGAAFRHKDKAENQRELVIFLSPNIIRERFSSNRTARPASSKLIREQTLPEDRRKSINRELTRFE